MSITINGTTGIAGVDGTASTPSVQGADANTGVFFPTADTVALTTAGAEAMRIDSSGNVGIGTSSPLSKLDVNGGAANTYVRIVDTRATYPTYIGAEQGSTVFGRWGLGESMRIDSSGQVLFGLTSSIGTGVAQFRGGIRGDNSSGDANFAIESRSGGTLYSSSIYNSTTSAGASVSITGTAGFLQRSTSSIKYKTDVEDLDQSLSANIYKMRPVWYRSKCEMDRKDWSYLGLIAEEVAEIEPRLVHWGEIKEDGTQEPEGVMYDRLTVLLLAEVKKQQAIITALEARIAALEAK